MSAPKRLFIFYNSFSLRLTENLHEQKTFSQNTICMFCLYHFSLMCIIKKIFILVRSTYSSYIFTKNNYLFNYLFYTVNIDYKYTFLNTGWGEVEYTLNTIQTTKMTHKMEHYSPLYNRQ